MLPNSQTHGMGIQAKLLFARVGMWRAEATVPSSASVKGSASYKNLHSAGGDPNPNLRIKARVCLLPLNWFEPPSSTVEQESNSDKPLCLSSGLYLRNIKMKARHSNWNWCFDPHVNEAWGGRQKERSLLLFLFVPMRVLSYWEGGSLMETLHVQDYILWVYRNRKCWKCQTSSKEKKLQWLKKGT